MKNFKLLFTFTEDATYVASLPTIAKGFTLAEVLITLGIISVVAAITIPALVSNYQKKAWTAQLQKSYAIMNQGFRTMLADNGVSALSQTEAFQSMGIHENNLLCDSFYNPIEGNCRDFYLQLRKYFQISDIKQFTNTNNYAYSYLNSNTNYDYTDDAIILSDGTIIFNYEFYGNSIQGESNNNIYALSGRFYIDINGVSKPNKYGRDIFCFFISDDGIIYPAGSKATSIYEFGEEDYILGYWKSSEALFYTCDKKDNRSKGDGCAARVLETGKMDY